MYNCLYDPSFLSPIADYEAHGAHESPRPHSTHTPTHPPPPAPNRVLGWAIQYARAKSLCKEPKTYKAPSSSCVGYGSSQLN